MREGDGGRSEWDAADFTRHARFPAAPQRILGASTDKPSGSAPVRNSVSP